MPDPTAPMPPAISVHTTMPLASILAMSDEDLEGLFTLDGEPLTPYQARVTAEHFQRRGLTYLPVCDHHDERGLCLGHAIASLDSI